MKKLALLLAVSLLALGLMTGCGDSSDEVADISGEWKLATIENANGEKQTLEEYCASVGVDTEGVEAIYEFDGDKKVNASIGGIGVDGTYTFDGSVVTATFEGSEVKMNYDKENDYLYASDANTGMTSYLERK